MADLEQGRGSNASTHVDALAQQQQQQTNGTANLRHQYTAGSESKLINRAVTPCVALACLLFLSCAVRGVETDASLPPFPPLLSQRRPPPYVAQPRSHPRSRSGKRGADRRPAC